MSQTNGPPESPLQVSALLPPAHIIPKLNSTRVFHESLAVFETRSELRLAVFPGMRFDRCVDLLLAWSTVSCHSKTGDDAFRFIGKFYFVLLASFCWWYSRTCRMAGNANWPNIRVDCEWSRKNFYYRQIVLLRMIAIARVGDHRLYTAKTLEFL